MNSHTDWLRFKDAHRGETGIVIGNGPSLATVPVSFLKSYPSFGSNRIWRILYPTYYCCTDPLDLAKNRDVINAMTGPKFVRAGNNVDGYQLEVVLDNNHPAWLTFSLDPAVPPIYDGCTVTYIALQLAYYMGFTTVLLVGVDHRYTWKGDRFTQQVGDGNDPNHWAKDYHLPGEIWQPPNLVRNEQSYRIALKTYEQWGRRIINLTEGTALDVFEKGNLSEWLQKADGDAIR